jgi:hypothetical protein
LVTLFPINIEARQTQLRCCGISGDNRVRPQSAVGGTAANNINIGNFSANVGRGGRYKFDFPTYARDSNALNIKAFKTLASPDFPGHFKGNGQRINPNF